MLVPLILLTTIAAALLITRHVAYHSIFCPSRVLVARPAGISADVSFDGLHLWHFADNAPTGDAKVVLFCHGNTGNISHRPYIVELCRRKRLNLLLFDYRGYGQSGGAPCVRGILADGLAAYDYLAQHCHYTPANIVVWGESLGGAVASYVATHRPCSRLILLCAFSDIHAVLDCWGERMRLQPLAHLAQLVVESMPVERWLAKLQHPVAILHSTEDELIPFAHAERNWAAIRHNAKVLIPLRGGHATPALEEHHIDSLLRFCGVDPDSGAMVDDILAYVRSCRDKHA